jgi:hypothetical protein
MESFRHVNPVAKASCDAITWYQLVEGMYIDCVGAFIELTREDAQSATGPTNASTILHP